MTFSIQDMVKLGLKRNVNELLEHGPGLLKLNIGAGNTKIDDCINVDYPEYDADNGRIPYPDVTVSLIHAYHFLEHVKEPIKVLEDFERVLCKGGIVNIVVPYYSSNLQAQDLTHVHAFSEETFPALLRQGLWYGKGARAWKFEINANFIFGIVERNLCLFVQLVKV